MSGRAHSAFFAFGVVAIDAMGIGIIIPVMPDLLQELAGASVGDAARWGGYLAFSYALMQFVFSPVIGALSDRYGRRPVLMISLATLAVDYVVMAMTPALWVLFVGRVVAGAAGRHMPRRRLTSRTSRRGRNAPLPLAWSEPGSEWASYWGR